MVEVEVGFKIKQTQAQAEQILKKDGYELMYSTQTHDLYFTNKKLDASMSEQQIKFSCVRFRHSGGGCSFDNYNIFKQGPDRFKCSLDEAAEHFIQLKQAGFNKVIDTFKTDFIYKKGNAYHQLQNIKYVGLLDYYYDEEIFCKPEKEQFDILKKQMLDLGFELEYELGIDKLRSLVSEKPCFSINQNGNYNQMK